MKAKTTFLAILLIATFAFSSCDKTEYRPVDRNRSFIIKTIEGKRQWGLITADHTIERIPCQYDSIIYAGEAPYNCENLFLAKKNGKIYVWDGDKLLLEGRGFDSFVSSRQDLLLHNNSFIGGALFNEARTSEGTWFFYRRPGKTKWFELGPAEALFWGGEAILFKENGKWGVMEGDWKTYKKPVFPCVYDAIICVNESYFWVKQNGQWQAIDWHGKKLNKSMSILKKYLQMPSLDYADFLNSSLQGHFSKLSVDEAIYIYVPGTQKKYVAW